MWIEPVVLTGRIVRLEPLGRGHAPALLRAAGEPALFALSPQQSPREWSVAGFEREIERVCADPASVAFAIVSVASGEAIGRTTYMDIRAEHRGLEIGRTWISRPHQGTLVNPECKYLMLRHAFEGLGEGRSAVRVQLKTGSRNERSIRAMEKLGAVREGVLRNHMIEPDGRLRDTVMFSMTEAEWPGVKKGLEGRLGYVP